MSPSTPVEGAPVLFVMAGGGTGGHVIPALAVARELRRRGHECVFFGTERGIEARLVPEAGFALECVRIGALKSVGLRRRLATLIELPFSTLAVWRWMIGRRPAAVFSLGGYAAGPPVLAALLGGIPAVIMEPNAAPGFTNRRIARFVARALVSFAETAAHFPQDRTEVTGLPVREEFFAVPERPPGPCLNVLITGGSQGSGALNRAARESWPLFRQAGSPIRLLHQTGGRDFAELQEAFARSGLDGEVTPFIEDMPRAFAEADLVVSRAGAGAVAELAAAGKPSLLAPFPYAADQHQRRNAEAFARAGAAIRIEDRDLTGKSLFGAVAELAGDPARLRRMGQAARALARPGAAVRAADILEQTGARAPERGRNTQIFPKIFAILAPLRENKTKK